MLKDSKSRRINLPLLAVLLTLTAFAISANVVPPLITTIANQLKVPFENFGYIFMLQYISFALACWFGGWLKNRFHLSNRSLVIAGVFGVSLLLIAGNFLPTFIWSVIWVIPLGFAGGLTETFSTIMITQFQKGDSSKLINLSQVFYCAGAIFAPHLVALLLARGIPWGWNFLILGSVVLLIAIIFTLATRHLSHPDEHTSLSHSPSVKNSLQPKLHHDHMFYLLAVALCLYVAIESAAACYLPAFFEEKFNIPPSSAAWRLSIFWTGLIIGRSLILALPAKWTLWPAVFVGTLTMMLGNILLSFNWPSAWATFFVLLLGLSAGPVWPVAVMISQRVRNSAAFTAGVIGAGALGAAIGPLLGSLIFKYLGLNLFFPLLAIAGALLFSLMLIAWQKSLSSHHSD